MQPRDRARAELYARARRLRWTLAGASVAAFGALVGLVVSNPIGTQAQAASPAATPRAATEPQSDDQAPAQPRSAPPPVSNAGQQPPILRTRRS